VQVPTDVRAFFEMWCTDHKSHDVKAIMSHFSDRFRYGGYAKRSWSSSSGMIRSLRQQGLHFM